MSLTTAHNAFRRIMTLMAAGNALPVVLDAIVLLAEAEASGILCCILLLDEAGRRLTLGAGPSLPKDYHATIQGLKIGPMAGSSGTAAHFGRRVIVEDIQTDLLWANYRNGAAAAGLRACWSQPIQGPNGAILGVFTIYHRHVSAPTTEDIAFIETAAELAAIAIARQRAEESLAQSEARTLRALEVETDTARDLTTFFEVSLDMLCIRDANLKFVKVNQAWERALGHCVEELEGSSMLRLIHPDDLPATQSYMQRIKVDPEIMGFVNRYRHRDGSYRYLEWRARRVGDLVFGAARDVTARLAFEAEIGAAKQAAEAANLAKSDFLANMSHEIRTPLNGVIGVVDALSRTELTPAQREMVGLIESSGVTLERLVSDILDVSKIEAGRLEIERRLFDLRRELASLIEMHQLHAQEKGVVFRVDFGDRARGEFHGDSTRIKQVLGNLLSNAVKFTTTGEIHLAVDVTDPATADRRAPPQASQVTFAVRDTGTGFDGAAATNLFQRFNQADTTITRRFGGTGLGLAICKTLVELMGGRIDAHSTPGRGSLFRVVIPLARNQTLDAYDANPVRSSPAQADAGKIPNLAGSLRILLAEDHPINQKVVQLILSPYGAEVTIVENGADAVEATRTSAFDLVLMDMQMPVMDGLAATHAIRENERRQPGRPRMPIIMLSANAMAQHRLDALAAGADLHIAKPVTAAALVAGIAEAMDRLITGPEAVPAARKK